MGAGNTNRNMIPHQLRTQDSILIISSYELGHQPLGIAWPLAFLKRAGFLPSAMDISAEEFDKEKVVRASFIGISVPMHTALRLGVQIAERIRKIHPDCRICFFGLYAQLNADFLLEGLADYVIGGEYESVLVLLVESLDSGDLGKVEAVSYPGKVRPPVLKRSSFPLPDRKFLPGLEKYAQLENNGNLSLVGTVEASRGCIHLCLHCPIPPVYSGRFFVVPKEIVLEDIRQLVCSGAKHITFSDPDFLNGPGHSFSIVKSMHEEYPEITFDFTAKIEHILKYRENFLELADSGCLFIVSAVESLSDKVLNYLKKGHNRKDIYEALSILRSVGISLRPSWVAFTPWTTLQDYIDMLEFVESESLIDHVDPVHYSIRLLVPPGSFLLSKSELHQFLGELDQPNFYYPWLHPDLRMDALYKRVSRLVAEATQENEDTLITFRKIKAVACQLQKSESMTEVLYNLESYISDRKRPPKLTEKWFCCAEPTENQLESVEF